MAQGFKYFPMLVSGCTRQGCLRLRTDHSVPLPMVQADQFPHEVHQGVANAGREEPPVQQKAVDVGLEFHLMRFHGQRCTLLGVVQYLVEHLDRIADAVARPAPTGPTMVASRQAAIPHRRRVAHYAVLPSDDRWSTMSTQK